eukprot:3954670-Amphidinium_carterae.1
MRSLHSAHNGYIGHWLKHNECDNEKSVDSGLAHNDTIGVRGPVLHKASLVAHAMYAKHNLLLLESNTETSLSLQGTWKPKGIQTSFPAATDTVKAAIQEARQGLPAMYRQEAF